MTEKQYHINVMCPQDMKNRLVQTTEERGFMNLSECIRGIIREYLRSSENAKSKEYTE